MMVSIPDRHSPSRRRSILARGTGLFALLVAPLACPTLAGSADRMRCDVVFTISGLPQGVAVGFLDFTVDYLRPKIFPLDPEGKVGCRGLVPGAAAAAANVFTGPGGGTLTIAFASEPGSTSALLRCDVFVAGTEAPGAADFPVLASVRAFDTAQAPIDPLPTVAVGEVRCGGTTTTTTSTELPPSTTTTLLEPELCSFRIRTDSAGALRRLRVDVDYSGAGGNPPAPAEGACRGLGGFEVGTLAEEDTLALDSVSVAAVQGPADVAVCDFVPETGVGGPEDFVVTALLANDGGGQPTAALPQVSASGVKCPSLTTTTTTTSTTLPAPVCGDADGDGEVTAGDALAALRMAVGLASACTVAVCDVDGSGAVKTSDALRILQAAVGVDVALSCPV